MSPRMPRPPATTTCTPGRPRTGPRKARRFRAASSRRPARPRSETAMRRPTVTPLLVLALAGCNTIQSPLDPASPQAQDLNRLFWIFVAVLGAIWLAVMVALALALRGRRTANADPLATDRGRDRRFGIVITGLAVTTGVMVLVLTGLSYAAQRRLFAVEEEAVTIRVMGQQWWWQFTY